jgi:uncharacterized repeat protein (TIGR03803 family)
MRLTQLWSPLITAAAFSVVTLALAVPSWGAPKYKVLHAFTGGSDGGGLWGSLLLDQYGNIYGTTASGGPKGKGGTVFKLSRQTNGTWTQTVLYSFCSLPGCKDGGGSTAGLIFDGAGHLYGTTRSGGTRVYGTAFELIPQSGGTWVETVLYNFPLPGGGCCPYGGVVMGKSGNLYGATYSAFELTPGSKGWRGIILHNFTGQHGDGSGPLAGVILDSTGNLYGTTELGGSSRCGGGCGTVYQLMPTSNGKWKEHILHRFQARWDGSSPGVGALVLDSAGNLYGTAGGGNSGHGVVFMLSRVADDHWRETVLYNITGGANGDSPGGGVVMDKAGNLYGTTIAGGDANCGCGVVYKLGPGSKGKWKYTVLHRFTGYDGAQPDANLILDKKGNLYGTTATGGASGAGVAFEVTP